MTPLLTLAVHQILISARGRVRCSLDLGRSLTAVDVDSDGWSVAGQRYPFMKKCKERTIYYWDGEAFEPVSRYQGS